MRDDEALLTFLKAPVAERFKLALNPSFAPAIKSYLGSGEFARYVVLAAASQSAGHLGVTSPENVVFVPGVMGSLLASQGLSGVWWIDPRTRNHIDDLRLAPDANTDADPRSRIEPVCIDTSYEGFLAAVLATPDLNHRAFYYDWRKPLSHSTEQLCRVIAEVHARNGQSPVHLVAHSMGGLLIRAALMEKGDSLWPMIDRICFIATPHYGAPAVAGYLKNHFWGFDMLVALRIYLSRETFRSLWGVLELLPAPAGVYPGTRDGGPHPCGNFDFYHADSWRLDLNHDQQVRLQAALDDAALFHRRLYEHHMNLDQDLRNRMAVIAGAGKSTLFRLAFRHGLKKHWKGMDKLTKRDPPDPNREGDGRVPLASARLEYVGTTRYVRGKHSDLPNMKSVSEDVFHWFRGESMSLPDSLQGALAQHLGPGADGDEEDPGFLEPLEDEPSREILDALDNEIEAGQRPEFIFTKLL